MTSHSRILAACLLALLLGALPSASQESAELDTGIPSQDLFADWPPEALRTRPYRLPWAYPSFQRASLFARPILFVLTVEWNHLGNRVVREVLGDPELTRRINEEFIVIAADGDRRPDLKERFLQNGWPSVHLLLPDGSPMISGIAGEADQRRPIASGPLGLPQATLLVEEGAKYWRLRPTELREIAGEWMGAQLVSEPAPIELSVGVSDAFARLISGSANRRDGGFGLAPHFLRPSVMEYAAVAADRGQTRLADHARRSLEKLVASPLIDAEDGGLQRLAANADWSGIASEKLLGQQAALMRELTVALRREPSAELESALAATARFVVDHLGRAEGGFHHSQPAGELPVQELVLAGPTASVAAALIRAGGLLDDAALVEAGVAALDYVLAEGWQPGRGFRHVLTPRPTDRLFLTAQADVAFALVDAYQATGHERFLDAAREGITYAGLNLREGRQALLRDHLRHPQAVGVMQLPRWPLGPNVRYARTLLRLAAIDDDDSRHTEARAMLARLAAQLETSGAHGAELALAIEELERDPLRIRLSGTRRGELLRAVAAGPAIWSVVVHGAEEGKARAEVTRDGETRTVGTARELAEAIGATP